MAAVSVTLGLGVLAGVTAKNLTSTAAAPATHISQGLGGAAQENPAHRGGTQFVGGDSAPAAAKSAAPVLGNPGYRGGTQIVGGDSAPSASQPARSVKPHGYF
jgi:hypothetical protein